MIYVYIFSGEGNLLFWRLTDAIIFGVHHL